MTELELKIYEIVRRVPEGRVITYGQVARLAGNARLARVVGNVMHKNPVPFFQLAKAAGFAPCTAFDGAETDFEPVPCHRVVNSNGKMGANFGMGGPQIQAAMLKAEGVEVANGKVDLKKFGIEPAL